MATRLGPAAPGPGTQETEVLRRFRSFAASALRHGELAAPSLEGIRANERRVTALLTAWSEAAIELAGERRERAKSALEPLVIHFRNALRATHTSRSSRGVPRAARRAVTAAIDRVSDSFMAVEADSGLIVDANPAAGALLGVARDALLGIELLSFIPPEEHATWWTHLDAMSEGSEPRRFAAKLLDREGNPTAVECTFTCFATRARTLALIVARPELVGLGVSRGAPAESAPNESRRRPQPPAGTPQVAYRS